MIAPLYLIEMAGLIPCDPGLVVHYFHWMLWIDKIRLQLQILYVINLVWNMEAFPELRDMKYIMNRG